MTRKQTHGDLRRRVIQVEGSTVANPSSETGSTCSRNRKMPRVAAEDGKEWVAGDKVG